jgi:protein-S-isoprenylcysteine O-methyltransferase Ste14
MFIRALIAFLLLPFVVAGIIPFLIVFGNPHLAGTAPLGIVLAVIGFVLLLWCVRDFYVAGKGTLAPWDPPKSLVIIGLYRFVRNPMYIAVLTLVAGWGLMFGSIGLGIYVCILAIGFHLRVIMYEEPWLGQQFGPDWEAYSKAVSRWLPQPPGNKDN